MAEKVVERQAGLKQNQDTVKARGPERSRQARDEAAEIVGVSGRLIDMAEKVINARHSKIVRIWKRTALPWVHALCYQANGRGWHGYCLG